MHCIDCGSLQVYKICSVYVTQFTENEATGGKTLFLVSWRMSRPWSHGMPNNNNTITECAERSGCIGIVAYALTYFISKPAKCSHTITLANSPINSAFSFNGMHSQFICNFRPTTFIVAVAMRCISSLVMSVLGAAWVSTECACGLATCSTDLWIINLRLASVRARY